jgi:chloramphenicol 3-O phosphotransferase
MTIALVSSKGQAGSQKPRSRFSEHGYHLVAVTCSLEVLESRERARGDRRPGQARAQLPRVLQSASYALTLDTAVLSVADCVERVLAILPAVANAR